MLNIALLKALLDAKTEEIKRLANYFDKQATSPIFNIEKLRDELIGDDINWMKVENHCIGFQNTVRGLLHTTTDYVGQDILFDKANEAYTLVTKIRFAYKK